MDLEEQQNILASLYVSEKYRTNYNYKEFNNLNLGSIPSEISNLSNLRELILISNNFS